MKPKLVSRTWVLLSQFEAEFFIQFRSFGKNPGSAFEAYFGGLDALILKPVTASSRFPEIPEASRDS